MSGAGYRIGPRPDAASVGRGGTIRRGAGQLTQPGDCLEIISCGPAYRPAGLVWPHLGEEQIAAIPVLATMANKR